MKHFISLTVGTIVAVLLSPITLFAAISDTPIPFDIISPDGFIEVLATDGETLYVGGTFSEIASTTRQGFAAFDIESQTLLPLDLELDGSVYSLLIDGGTIYVGGDFTDVNNGTDRQGLAAFSMATGIATAFDPQVEGSVSRMLLDGTTLYIGGSFSCVGDYVESCDSANPRNNLAAVDTGTGEATAFDPNVDGSVYALAFDETEGVLYVGGTFTDVNGGTTRNYLAGFDTATGKVTAFDAGDLDDSVTDLLISNNQLYVSGNFSTVGEAATRNRVAVFNIDPEGIIGLGYLYDFDVDADGTAYRMYLDGSEDVLYLAGTFTTVNGDVNRQYIASVDAGNGTVTDFSVSFVGDGINGFAVDGEGSIYIGGGFTQIGGQNAGGLAYFPVVVDETAPTIESLTPADNAVDVDTLDELTIVFDEDVESTLDTECAIRIHNDTDASSFVVFSDSELISVDGDEVTVTLLSALEAGDDYHVIIDDCIFQDLAGNAFAGIDDETTWNFSVAAEGEEVEEEEESSGGSGGSSSHRRSDSNSGNQRDPIVLLMEELVGLLQQLLEQLLAEQNQ